MMVELGEKAGFAVPEVMSLQPLHQDAYSAWGGRA